MTTTTDIDRANLRRLGEWGEPLDGPTNPVTPGGPRTDICDRDLREAIERCLTVDDLERCVIAENTYPSLRRLAKSADDIPADSIILCVMRDDRALRLADVEAVAYGREVVTINEATLTRIERLRDADLPGKLRLDRKAAVVETPATVTP